MQGAIAVLNLLIAEDERFTREGLYYEIDWNSLGIGQVKLAENGLKALNIMDTFIPDILLADVRMPKMNGIDLAYRVKTINPDCSVIFMSGYSDKEYLLSAIEINALNYVEKPLNIDEVIQSLKKAVEAQYNIMKKNHYIESELANKLSYRGIHNQKDVVSYSKFIPALHDNLKARTILLTNSTRKLSLNANFINKIPEIKRKLKSLNLDSIIGIKDNQWLMIHIFYDCILESNLIKQIIYEIYRCMESILDLDEELYLSLGKTVSDIFKIYASFESANSALDNIFFSPKQKIHCYQETKANANSFDMENIVKFASYLKNGREQDSIELIKTIKSDLCNNSKIGSSTAKNIFLSLFMELGIGVLTRNYNYMVNRLNHLMEEKYKSGQQLKMSELKALQAQINPHFLYNTLEMINWLVKRDRTEDIITVTTALSNLYKISLNRGEDLISIRDELLHVESYIKIQNMRFDNKLNYIAEIDESLLEYNIPKLILQPIVENSIFHGILEKDDQCGTIMIKLYSPMEDFICLEVRDDGVGIPEDKFDTLLSTKESPGKEGSQYGLKNIYMRLKLMSDDNNLVFTSQVGKGTTVKVLIKKLTAFSK